MKGYADEVLVVGGEKGVVACNSSAKNVEVEAGGVVVVFLGAIFGLRDYAGVVEGESGAVAAVVGESIVFEFGQGLRGLIREEPRRDVGVFEGQEGDVIEDKYAVVLREGEVEDKGTRYVFSDLFLQIPKRQVGNVEADEHTSLFFQPLDTTAGRLFPLTSRCDETENVEMQR